MERVAGQGVGTYDITVTGFDTEGNYDVTFVGGTFTIEKRDLKISAQNKNVRFKAEAPEYTARFDGFAFDDDVSDLSGSPVFTCAYTPGSAYAESYVISVSGYSSSNYNIIYQTGELTVEKIVLADPAPVHGIIYNGTERYGVLPNEGYTVVNGIKIDAGSYTATVSLKAGYSWADGNTGDKTIDWSIEKKLVGLTLSDSAFRYDSSEKSVSVLLSGIVTGDDVSVAYSNDSVLTATSANSYHVIVSGLSGTKAGNYVLPTTDLNFTWVIADQNLVVSKVDYSGTYDGNGHSIELHVYLNAADTYTIYYSETELTDSNYTGGIVTTISKVNAGIYTIYYYVKAANHTDVKGSATITITKKAASIDVYDTSKIYSTNDPTSFTAKVTGAIGNEELSYNITRVAGENVGSYTLTATADSDGVNANYDITCHTGVLVITPKLLESTMLQWNDNSHVYNGSEQSPTYTLKHGEADITTYCTVSGNVKTNVGAYYMEVRGSGNYTGSVSKVWYITPMSITVTGGSSKHVYDGILHEVTTYTVSELAVGDGYVESSLQYYARKLSSGTHKGSFTGDLKIVSGNDDVTSNYTVTYVSGSVVITKKPFTDDMLTVSGTYVYNGHKQFVDFAMEDGDILFPEDFAVTGHFGTDAKTYTITITATDSGDYSGSITKTWTIGKRGITITGKSGTVTYNGAEQSITEYTVSNIVSGHAIDGLQYVAKGTTAINHGGAFSGTAKVIFGNDDVTDNYDITTVEGHIYILPMDISDATITLGSVLTYNGQNQTQKIDSVKVGDLTVNMYTVAGATAKNAGTYTLIVSGNNNFTGQKSVSWSILKADLKVTTPSYQHTYDGTEFTMNGSIIGLMDAANSIIFRTTGAITDVGSVRNGYELIWETANPSNYNIVEDIGTLEVIQRNISGATVVLGPSNVYDGNAQVQSVVSVKVGDLTVNTYVLTGHIQTNAGEYRLTVTGTGNFTGTVKDIVWSIEKRALSDEFLTVSGTYVYDGTPKAVSYEVGGAYPIVTGDYTVAGNVMTNAGTHTLTLTATDGGNYSGSISVSWTIEKRALYIVSGSADKVYDGTPLTSNATVTGFVMDDIRSFSPIGTVTDVGSVVNEVSIVWKDGSVSSNYEIHYDLGTLTVTKRAVILTGASDTVTYDGVAHTLTSIEASGLVDGHRFDGLTYYVTGTSAGEYLGTFGGTVRIMVGNVDVSDNYDITIREGTLIIEKKAFSESMLSVSGSYIYNGADQTVSYVMADGNILSPGDYSVSGHIAANAGTHTIVITATDPGNYVGSITKTWIIQKKTLTVTGESGVREYNRSGHTLTGYTVEGLIDGHHVAHFTYTATGIHIAQYEGVFYGDILIHDVYEMDMGDNYDLIVIPGVLTIIPRDISSAEVTLGDLLVYNGMEQTKLIASVIVDGFLILTYDISGNTGTDAGIYTLRIDAYGDYSGHVEKEWTITKKALMIHTEDARKEYDGTPLNAKGTIDGLVNGETCTFTLPGSITDAGHVTNEYVLVWDGTAKESNYYIIEDIGMLIVGPKDITDAVVELGPQLYYDGTLQTQAIVSVTIDGMNVTYDVVDDSAVDIGDYILSIIGTGNFMGVANVPWSLFDLPEYVPVIWGDTVFVYNGEVQDVEAIVRSADGTLIPYHLEYYDLNGSPVVFRDVGKYVVVIVLDDLHYMIDGDSSMIVEILAEPVDQWPGINVWLVLLVLTIAVLAAYLPVTYLFGFGFRHWAVMLVPLLVTLFTALILEGVIHFDIGMGLVVVSIMITGLAAYLPISYLMSKK